MKIHLIGIAGTGMVGLARLLMSRGDQISGSDQSPCDLGGPGEGIHQGHRADQIPIDCDEVVVSLAIPEHNPELIAARDRGLPICDYATMLGRVTAERDLWCIAGTHGKSTISAWLYWALKESGQAPGTIVGAPHIAGLPPSDPGETQAPFVLESCEFGRSFLNFKPQRLLISNVESDHLDYFQDMADIEKAFIQFVSALKAGGRAVLGHQVPTSIEQAIPAGTDVIRYGPEGSGCSAWVSQHPDQDGCYQFHLPSNKIFELNPSLRGEHNRLNLLGLLCLASDYCEDSFLEAAATFPGAGRRFEELGRCGQALVINDYAHHPTEIAATLQACQEKYPERKQVVVFQPHQHSRTRFLLDDFAQALASADKVYVPDIFFVRDSESEKQRVNSEHLVRAIVERQGQAFFVPSLNDIVAKVKDEDSSEPHVILCLGAGDIGLLPQQLVDS